MASRRHEWIKEGVTACGCVAVCVPCHIGSTRADSDPQTRAKSSSPLPVNVPLIKPIRAQDRRIQGKRWKHRRMCSGALAAQRAWPCFGIALNGSNGSACSDLQIRPTRFIPTPFPWFFPLSFYADLKTAIGDEDAYPLSSELLRFEVRWDHSGRWWWQGGQSWQRWLQKPSWRQSGVLDLVGIDIHHAA